VADRRRRKGVSAPGRAAVSKRPKVAHSRSAPKHRTNRRKAVAVLTPEMLAELEAVVVAIEAAVHACIRWQRWDDLSAAVANCARLLQLDPGFLLHAALIRGKAREGLTLTDPVQRRHYAEHLRASIELGNSGMSLTQVIGMIRSAVEHRPAFDAFDALGREELPALVH